MTARTRLLTTLLAASLLGATACGAVDDAVGSAKDAAASATEAIGETSQLVRFCTSALQVAQAVNDEDLDKAVREGEDMVANAPDDIRGEAEIVLAGAKEAQGGDYARLQSQEFEDAASALATYTQDRCDPRS